jgi:DNA-binding SARP family transcriptional activator/tetratricopeptide (TPR) repeat protein
VPLEIHLAGQLNVVRDGVSAELDGVGRLGRVALAYLIDERRRPVSHDELAEAIWDVRLPPTWRSALRGVVARLRSVFTQLGMEPDDVIVTGPGSYQLVLPVDVIVDLEVAASSFRRADEKMSAEDPAGALDQTAAVLTLTERPLLPGCDGTWVAQRQDRWRGLRLSAMHLHGVALRETGAVAAAVTTAERLILLDPLRESSYVCLMDAHDAAGNRAQAIRTFARCRSTLIELLGTEPSAATHAVYRSLLQETEPIVDAGIDHPDRPIPAALTNVRSNGPRLVGRDDVLSELRAGWAAAREGERRVAVVSGASGMGKTRIAAELAAAIAGDAVDDGDRAVVLYGTCDEDVVVPYQPFLEALRPEVEACDPADLRQRAPRGVSELSRLFPWAMRFLDEGAADAPRDAGDRLELFEAVTALITGAAERQPLLLILDDLHWADRPTLLLLRHVLGRLEAGSILVVLITRSAPEALDDVFDVLPATTAVRDVAVGPLDVDAVRELAVDLLGASPADVAQQLLDETDGSPFLVGELLRQLADTDAAGLSASTQGTAPIATSIGIPQRVLTVLDRRLDRLHPDTRTTLRIAALAGRTFDLDVIEHAAGLADGAVLDALDEARSAGLVDEVEGRTGRFSFAHSLIRHVLSDEVGAARAARIHRRLAAAIDVRRSISSEALGDLLRHHRLAVALTLDPAPLVEAAVRVAADALAKLAYEDAVDHVASTLTALVDAGIDDPIGTARLELKLAAACDLSGDRARARAAYLNAFEAARRTADGGTMGRAALGIGGPWTTTGEVDAEQVAALEASVTALEGTDDDRLRAILLARLTRAVRYAPGFGDRGPRLAESALAAARRSGDAASLSAALLAQRVVLHGPEGIRERLDAAEELTRLADAGGRSADILDAGPIRIMALFEAGEHDRSDEAVRRYADLADESRRPYHRWCATYLRAVVAMRSGRFDAATHHIEAARDIGLGAQLADVRTVYGTQTVMLLREEGRLGKLEAFIRALNERGPTPRWSELLAWVLASAGRIDEALAVLPARVTRRRDPQWLAAATFTAETVALAGLEQRARDLYAELVPYAGTDVVVGPGVAWIGPIDHSLGVLAAVIGRVDVAERHLTRALEATAALGGACPAHLRAESALAGLSRGGGRA